MHDARLPVFQLTGLPDRKQIMVYERGAGQPVAIYDGEGDMLDETEVPPSTTSSASRWPPLLRAHLFDEFAEGSGDPLRLVAVHAPSSLEERLSHLRNLVCPLIYLVG